MSRLKLGTKLIGGFLIVAAIAIVIGLTGLSTIKELGSIRLPGAMSSQEIQVAQQMILVGERGLTNRRMMSHEIRNAQYEYIEDAWEQADENIKKYDALPHWGTEATAWKEFKQKWGGWKELDDRVVELSHQKDQMIASGMSLDSPAIEAMDAKIFTVSLESREKALEIIDLLKKIASINVEEAEQHSARGRNIAVTSMVIGFLIAMGLGVFLTLSITKPMNKMAKVAEKISVGDIDQKIEHQSHDEIGSLADSFRQMIDYMNEIAQSADDISKGNIDVSIEPKSDKDILSKSFVRVRDTLKSLVGEVGGLTNAAVQGRLDTRGDATKFEGGYRDIVNGFNSVLDSIVGNFEAVPVPIQFMDKNFRIQYINETGAKLLGNTKESLLGKRCMDMWNTSKCRTKDCPCQIAMDNDDIHTCENDTHIGNKKLDIYCAAAPLKDVNGQIVGSFEFVTDQTDIKEAMRVSDKIAAFQAEEASKLTGCLKRLSNGDLDFELVVADADANTAEARKSFDMIADAVKQSVNAISMLVADANMLSEAAVEGKLDTRADASKHNGDFRKIVEGVNNTLDAVIHPVNEASDVLEKLAQNDLTARVTGEYKGDHAKIKNSLNKALDILDSTMTQALEACAGVLRSAENVSLTAQEVVKASQSIAETINQVAVGSVEQSKMAASSSATMEQLAIAIDEVDKGAQSQAKTMEETASQLQQIAQAIESVAKSAQSAAITSSEVAEIAKSGGASVGKSVEGMARIKESTTNVANAIIQLGDHSKRIGAIVETIDDIAEQTNLLALNAAIEAARAGEHGKGFAVVADEVRKLAERSSLATKEIADLITSIQEMTENAVNATHKGSAEVEAGTQLANEAGDALTNILNAINAIVQQIEDVSAASEEMTASSAEVMRAVESLSAITEESTAATEEMAASSTDVLRSIEQVAAVSEQNAASSEAVAAAAEEQNAAMEEMTAYADESSNTARELQTVVCQFKVSKDVEMVCIDDNLEEKGGSRVRIPSGSYTRS